MDRPCSKAGGLICQGLSTLAAVPAIGIAAVAIGTLAILSFGLIGVYGRETQGLDLRKLEPTHLGSAGERKERYG
jgi:putative MFS transporter